MRPAPDQPQQNDNDDNNAFHAKLVVMDFDGTISTEVALWKNKTDYNDILTHSQSGPFGWLIADARPQLVKAVVAVEPAGPPFENAVFDTNKARAWGVTDIAITYDPPVNDPAELKVEQQTQPDGPDLVLCRQQQAPAHGCPV